MAASKTGDKLPEFLQSGIYRFKDSNAVFIDPVRVMNRSYTRFKVSPSSYYTRSFESKPAGQELRVCTNSRKRKRKEKKKPQALNEREQVAEQRHQQVRPFLLKAHESLAKVSELLEVMGNVSDDLGASKSSPGATQSLVDLGRVWQAPMYEITLNFHPNGNARDDGGSPIIRYYEQRVLPAFNTLVVNETNEDVEAELVNCRYILPPKSSFYMSDLGQIHNLIPAESDCGFNLIVVDPPWENGSARQKLRYSTLPNRYFLSLPIKQFCHTDGALVALWVTNREKLRVFVEEELFPAWGVKYVATFFWLKVKADGSLICDLDLFHHRPYECLLLGLCPGKGTDPKHLLRSAHIPDNQIMLSTPGDYSRKPPIAGLLEEYAPSLRQGRRLELFAREMTAGWISWGNEPLQFQESRNFLTG